MSISINETWNAFFFAFCASVALFDLRHRKVPNELIGLAIVTPLLFTLVSGPSGTSISIMIAGAAIGFATLIPFYIAGKMGAGDVKFFSVVGLWLGIEPLLPIFIIGSLLAGTQAAITLLLRSPVLQGMPGGHRITQGSERVSSLLQGWSFADRGIPYAAWLAVGALAWLFHQPTL